MACGGYVASFIFLCSLLHRYGSPYTELSETSHIVSNEWVSTIEYKGKGYFSGKSHSFKATVSPTRGHARDHVVEGLWHTTSKYVSGLRSGQEFHNVDPPHNKVEVTAVGGEAGGEMGEYETRKLWKAVAKGIREGDFETASREKTKIEVLVSFLIHV